MPTTEIIFSYAVLGGGALVVYLILTLIKERIEKSKKYLKKKKLKKIKKKKNKQLFTKLISL